MSLANPLIVLIDGTDYGPAGLRAVKAMNGDCTGVDRIGVAHITLTFPASAGYVFVPTREVQIYIETYTGAVHTGNNPLFGGCIKIEGITVLPGPAGQTIVKFDCQDYNFQLDAIQTDLHSTNTDFFTLGADTFEHQVRDMVLAFQKNGRVSSPPSLIDATHNVGAICGAHVFSALNVQYGLSLREGLRILMQRAVAFNSALRPRFFLELVDDVSVPANVICGLVVYDSAAGLPASSLTFAEIPGVGEHTILAVTPHVRTFDASMPLSNYVQSVWHPPGTDWVKVKTSEGATSEATYYNPYINGGLTGNKGPWKLPIIKDTNSQTDAEAQTVADLARYSKEFPRETFVLSEDGVYVQPGTTVTIKTTNINAPYEVTAVKFDFLSKRDPTKVRYALSCGLPLLELFDDSSVDWTKAPILGDFVPPNPPGAPTLISNTYNVDTGQADITVSYAASPSPDTRGYGLLIVNTGTGAHYWFADVGTTLRPTVSVPSGIPFSLDVYAFDGASPPNYSTSGGQITGVTASPTYYALTNPGFETINSQDATMPYAWTKAVTGTGAVQRDTAQHNSGAAAGKLTNGASAGTAALVCAEVVVGVSTGYQLLFFARSDTSLRTLVWTVTWYAADGITVLGTSTGTCTPPNGTWGRFSGGPVPAANAAFYALKFSISGTSAFNIWVDTVFMQGQVGPGGLEPGVVTPAMTVFGPVSGSELHYRDESGVPVYDMFWSSGSGKYILAPRADDGTYPSPGFQLKGGTTAPTTLDLTDNGLALDNHFIASGASAPSLAGGSGAGTGPTLSISGDDKAGVLTVTTGTGLPAGNSTIVTVTFAHAYGSTPQAVLITPAEANAAARSGSGQPFADSAGITTAHWILKSGPTGLAASTTYKFFYWVIG